MSALIPPVLRLMLQPYWSPSNGDGPETEAIIGFNEEHTRAHLYRADQGLTYAPKPKNF